MSKELDLTGVLHFSVPPTLLLNNFAGSGSSTSFVSLHLHGIRAPHTQPNSASHGSVRMVLTNPPYAKTYRAVLIHLQVVGSAQGRRFILVPQLLFSLLPKFFFPSLRLAVQLSEFIRPLLYFFFSRICHDASSPDGAGAVSFWPFADAK